MPEAAAIASIEAGTEPPEPIAFESPVATDIAPERVEASPASEPAMGAAESKTAESKIVGSKSDEEPPPSGPDRIQPADAKAAASSRPSLVPSVVVGAIAGAIAASLIVFVAANVKRRSATDLQAIEARLTALEGAREAQSRELTTSLAEVRRGLEAERTASAQTAASLADAVAKARQGTSQAIDAALAPVQARLKQGEAVDQALKSQMATVAAGQSVNLGAALLSASQALETAFVRGAPIGDELKAVEALQPKSDALDALRAFVKQGAPSPDALRREFQAVRPKLIEGRALPSDASLVDRLAASAGGLVTVRPTGARPGSDPAAIVSRIDAALAAGNFGDALKEAQSLPERTRSASKAFIDHLEARAHAARAIQSLENDALHIITDRQN